MEECILYALSFLFSMAKNLFTDQETQKNKSSLTVFIKRALI